MAVRKCGRLSCNSPAARFVERRAEFPKIATSTERRLGRIKMRGNSSPQFWFVAILAAAIFLFVVIWGMLQ
jgi:hypothetical protein